MCDGGRAWTSRQGLLSVYAAVFVVGDVFATNFGSVHEHDCFFY